MTSLNDIREARERIADGIEVTPCLHSGRLSERCGAEIFLKAETLQRTGSFKPRGALNKLLSLSAEERRRGVVAASAGNHAQGVAYAASRVGVRATIVMPETTPLTKVTRTRDLGAEVMLNAQSFDDAVRIATELRDRHGTTLVHAFNDEEIIAGQGTCGLEILEQLPDLDAVIAPIGGGGLISGIATAIKEQRPEVKIYGVQSESAPAMKRSLDGRELTPVDAVPTLAEGIAIKRPGDLTFPIVQRLVDDVELVSEEEIENAIYDLLERGKALTEGAGAAAYAALANERFPGLAGKRIVVVLSGANIDLNILGRIIERSLVKQSRLVRLRISIKDRPGGLAALLQIIADHEANVLHIHHNRIFTRDAFWKTEVEVTLETRDHNHIQELLAVLSEAGYNDIEELGLRILPPGQLRA